ncbi:hypothetical protein JXQ70_13470 [bacterium]|nr:hypothetical protein [bacterium]
MKTKSPSERADRRKPALIGHNAVNQLPHKSYAFSNGHNPHIPADYWFQSPPEGLTLFVVLYTRACRWARCLGCNLPSKVSQSPVHYSQQMKQIDFIFDFLLSPEQKQDLRKIILSNNGSVLDQETLSTMALIYFVAKMNMNCPHVSVLCLETRAEYVDLTELEVLSRALSEADVPADLELAIGFEAFDETIRNDYFHKGLSLHTFEELARKIAEYSFRLKVYFMLKPVPQITEQEAIEDVQKGIRYLDSIARQYKLAINLHLNPTFVAAGTPLEQAFQQGRYQPPLLESVRQAVLSAQGTTLSVFIGLNDEGLAAPGSSFIRPGDEKLLARLNEFNSTQNYALLK